VGALIAQASGARAGLALLCLAFAADAGAQAEAIALACPACHGSPTADAARAPAAVPWFYGKPADEIAWSLREFRAGRRQGSAMPRLAHALTDAEIEALARTYGGGG
jgi:cytochrome subunit of sulfide dehydrogenase